MALSGKQIRGLNGGTAVAPLLTDLVPYQTLAGSTDPFPATWAQVKTLLNGYISYTAALTQTSAAPTATVLLNDLGVTLTWAKTAGGFYSVTASAPIFTANKTFVVFDCIGSGGYSDPKLFTWQYSSTTVINFGSFRASDQVAEDGFIGNIEIRVYA